MNRQDNQLVTRIARAFGRPINEAKRIWERMLPEQRQEIRDALRKSEYATICSKEAEKGPKK